MNNEIGILMAAGLGSRMRPLTEYVPKPLVKVQGTPMIETVIRGLVLRGVQELYIVTGYLKEQFSYLISKYPGVSIVENTEYKTVNNISSIKAVTNILRGRNAFICEADLFIPNPSILSVNLEHSCYFGKFVKGHSDDWIFEVDTSGKIVRIGKIGDDCYNMCGISFFLENDSTIIADAIEERYSRPNYSHLFWDEVVNENLNRLNLTIHPVTHNSIIEIDSLDELCLIDNTYTNKKE